MYRAAISIAFACLIVQAPASAQCADWTAGFDLGGVNGPPTSQVVHDDGGGPALYVGGYFTHAGTVPAARVARWDGTSWSGLASGIGDGHVSALCTIDDGNGSVLYAGGTFSSAGGVPANNLARWNGVAWSAVGSGLDGPVYALHVHDDGTGPALYVGGEFTNAGGAPANSVARWDGAAWSPLSSGITGSNPVYAFETFDDGNGSALYVGGNFAGGVARWNGTNWSALGSGVDAYFGGPDVHSLRAFDDGSGPELYVGGAFEEAGGSPVHGIARWNGTSWSAVGDGNFSMVNDLEVFVEAGTPRLFASGGFSIRRWDGTQWSALGAGTNGYVVSLAVFDDGSGAALHAAGSFTSAGGQPARYFARWNGTAWSAPSGGGNGIEGTSVLALQVFDGRLVAAGDFTAAGSTPANRLATWDGSTWQALGNGPGAAANALAVFDDGSGEKLVATAAGVARWNGSTWNGLGFIQAMGRALAVYDDGSGPRLYVGGGPGIAGGSSPLAWWNGSSWSAVAGISGDVQVLLVYDDGSGPALYAGGSFFVGQEGNNLARFDGASWEVVGGGTNSRVWALAGFDDGSGPALYAGGEFTLAGGIPAERIARWDGAAWSAVSSGFDGAVVALAAMNDGAEPALFAGGAFSHAGAVSTPRIARWNGATWSGLGSGMYGENVRALAVYDDGADGVPDLYVGGRFIASGDQSSSNIAEWQSCVLPGVAFCDSSAGTCPCGNAGLPGHGCENSAGTGGSLLAATGRASLSADSLQFTVTGERPTALSTFWQGTQSVGPLVYGDGLRCMGGALKRLRHESAVAGVVIYPDGAETPVSVRSAALGDTLFVGARRIYQVTYRDPNAAFCPPGTYNISGAFEIVWAP